MEDNQPFILEIRKSLNDKMKEYRGNKEKHAANEKKLKFIYNIFGCISFILSSITTFLTGIYTFEYKSFVISLCLGFSLVVTIINSLLNFSNIQKKESQHHDNMLQYKTLCLDIDEFKTNKNITDCQYENFYNLLIEKEKLISNYEITPCF